MRRDIIDTKRTMASAVLLALLSAFMALPVQAQPASASPPVDDGEGAPIYDGPLTESAPLLRAQVEELPPVPKEEALGGPDVRVHVGALVDVMTGSEAEIEPAATIDVGWTLFEPQCPVEKLVPVKVKMGDSAAEKTVWVCSERKAHIVKAHVVGQLTALPGDAIDITDPSSFRSLEFELGVSWAPFPAIAASAYAAGGFASRLPSHGREPLDEAPKYASFGLLFEAEKRAAWLSVGMGPDQRLDGRYVLAIQAQGGLDLLRDSDPDSRFEGTALTLQLNAALGLEHSPSAPGRRDIVRVAVTVAWGG